MRKVKITSVRLNDYVSEHKLPYGLSDEFRGVVMNIMHVSPNMIDVTINRDGAMVTQMFAIDGPAGFTPDTIYRER